MLVIVIVIAAGLVMVELQIRAMVREEKSFDKRLRRDEKVLYDAEKELKVDISRMKKQLEHWKHMESTNKWGETQ